MRADQVLIEHHNVLRALCKDITGKPAGSAEREERVDDLMVELDIHMRIEDDLFYPAVAAAGPLAGFLRTNPTDAAYEGEWQAFVTTLDAHAEEEERDLFPPPVEMSADELDGLGNRMLEQMDEVRTSWTKRLRIQARGAVLRKM